MFTPWRYNLDSVAQTLLQEVNWQVPDPSAYPTGQELVDHFLEPLAAHPAISPNLRFNCWVWAVGRYGRDKLASHDRVGRPFVVRLLSTTEQSLAQGEACPAPVVEDILARAVLDASGVIPNPLKATGFPTVGKGELAEHITYGMPNVLGPERQRYAGKRILVVGAGHSAFGVLLDLVRLAEQEAGTTVHWAVRRRSLAGRLGSPSDELPERGRLGQHIGQAVAAGRITLHVGVAISRIEQRADGLIVWSGDRALPAVDEIIGTTGYRPDQAPLPELGLSLAPLVEAPVALAPLIDPNRHSCGTVPLHGVQELTHPKEPDFFLVGFKSYGRAPTFLRTGYEQVRSVVAALAGDQDAAHRVELVLPATGVCCTSGDDGRAQTGNPNDEPGNREISSTKGRGDTQAVPLLTPTRLPCC